MSLQITPIGYIRSPYKEKFGVPRQPGLVESAIAQIQLSEGFDDPNCLRGIEQFSHLWLIFSFHQTVEKGWRPLVRPPRLGGNEKIGVFASRSTFRPNGLGLSAVKLLDVDHANSKLTVCGIDLVDNTPIIDIKPYLSYSDAIHEAASGYASASPEPLMPVTFSHQAKMNLAQVDKAAKLKQLISDVLSQDPRPAYQQNQSGERIYGMQLDEFDVRWQVIDNTNCVLSIDKLVQL